MVKVFYYDDGGKKITSRIFVESKGRFSETNENFFFGRGVQCMVCIFNEVSKTSFYFLFFIFYFLFFIFYFLFFIFYFLFFIFYFLFFIFLKKKKKGRKKKAPFSKCEYHIPNIFFFFSVLVVVNYVVSKGGVYTICQILS